MDKSVINAWLNRSIIKLLRIFSFWLILTSLCKAQVTFNYTYDSAGYETIFNILPVDSGYCMVMNLNQSPDGFQINFLDTLGTVSQSQSFLFPSRSPIIWSLLKTYDQNFITGCHIIDVNSGLRNLFLVKFNNQSDTIWSKEYLAPPGFRYYGRYFIETSDSGFLITGAYTDSLLANPEFCILKTDSVGNIQWVQSFGGINSEDAFSSVETQDKGFLTLGFTRSFGFGNSNNRDDLLVKWDSIGNYQWHKTFGTPDQEIGIGITRCLDGNYLIGSGHYVNSGFSQGKIVKIDVDGNIIWQKLIGNGSDSFWWVREKSNYDLVAIGSELNSNNYDNGFIVCTDSAGNEKWRRQYRFGNEHCYFRDVQETPDGGIICAGFVFDGASGNQDGWLVKLDSTGCLGPGSCGEPTGLFETVTSTPYDITVSPNPVIDQAIVKIEGLPQLLLEENYKISIYDIAGKLISSPRTGFLITDTGIQFLFNRENLNPGIYLLDISTYPGEKIGVVKVVVQ